MRLPSHVITKLTLAGAIGTVGAIVLLHPHQRTECKPPVDEPAPTAVEVDSEPLSDAFRTPHVPSYVVAKPPTHQPAAPIPVQIKAKPKPPRAFASSCGGLVAVDPSKPVLLPACGKG